MKDEDFKGYKIQRFSDRKQYTEFLNDLISKMNNSGEYSIFTHMICGHTLYSDCRSGEDLVKSRMNGILNNGLNLSSYSTIYRHTWPMGTSSKLNINSIIDYDYPYSMTELKPTLILAFPSKVKINGVEYDYTNPPRKIKEGCLADVVMGNKLPNIYVLGIQIAELDENNNMAYSFIYTGTHMSSYSSDFKKEHDLKVENKVFENMPIFNAEDVEDLICKRYDYEQSWYERSMDDEI